MILQHLNRHLVVLAMSYLPYSVLDKLGRTSRPWSRRWSMVSGAWINKDFRNEI